ncbi:MAG: hypothetical protein WDN69_18570 [Aliidongia sp.]
MTISMVEYVTFQVLRLHLKEPEFRRQQRDHVWRQLVPPAPASGASASSASASSARRVRRP